MNHFASNGRVADSRHLVFFFNMAGMFSNGVVSLTNHFLSRVFIYFTLIFSLHCHMSSIVAHRVVVCGRLTPPSVHSCQEPGTKYVRHPAE